MKQALTLPADCDGAAWRYVPRPYPLHRHAELEANLVVRGTARYLIAEHRLDLAPNGLLFLFPAQEHVLLDTSPDLEMWVVVWRQGLVRHACRTTTTRPLRARTAPAGTAYCPLPAADARHLSGLFARTYAVQASDPDRANALLALGLVDAWHAFTAAAAPPARAVHPAVERAAYLLRNGGEAALAWSLAELADRVVLSPSRLSRLFRRHTGVPLVRYRQKLLLERFLTLQEAHPHLTLTALALRAGFGSYPQFHRVFRQFTGESPAAYLAGRGAR